MGKLQEKYHIKELYPTWHVSGSNLVPVDLRPYKRESTAAQTVGMACHAIAT
jgi:hypothetical protein